MIRVYDHSVQCTFSFVFTNDTIGKLQETIFLVSTRLQLNFMIDRPFGGRLLWAIYTYICTLLFFGRKQELNMAL